MFHALVLAAAATLTPSQVGGIVGNAEKAFSSYVFPEVAAKAVAMLKQNVSKYEAISDPETFRQTVNTDLLSVTHDKHVRLWYPYDRAGGDDPSPADEQKEHEQELIDNFGFQTVRRLPGNVGYIDFRYFSSDASLGQTVASVMGFVGNTDALIIDLRKNGGGDPIAAETLEAYFFNQQQQITSLKWRDSKTGKVSEIQQYTAATVPGPLYLKKPIYLLTASRTFSCAEQFTYDLRNLKRVTLVGETTGGGANPGDVQTIGNHFGIFIPEGQAYSPVTKTNWEGAGIAPDISVTSAQALTRAYDEALHYVKDHTKSSDTREEVTSALKDEGKALATQP